MSEGEDNRSEDEAEAASTQSGDRVSESTGEATEASGQRGEVGDRLSAGNGDNLPPTSLTARRLERERRRAVRAESRLAEIELALRTEIDRSNGEGVPRATLQTMLEAVQSRVALLEDEVRAGEKELMDLSSAQRKSRGALAADDDDLAFGLEQARRELRDAVRSDGEGLPELTRQRVEFEVELDRLQSLLAYRDNVCDGLAEELEQGTRVAAEVTARLTDLSRGRVAPTRRPASQDARVATLRRNLESEQAQLRQARRALETARAELKVAQRGVIEIEERSGDQIQRLRAQIKELEVERENLRDELNKATRLAADQEGRQQQELDSERIAHMQAKERVRELETRLADLESQISLSGGEREGELRMRVEQREEELRQTEEERIRLAERVSLLQAALSSKETELRRAGISAVAPAEGGKGKVVALMQDRSVATDAPAADAGLTSDLVRQRAKEIERLSNRWRELQGAYREAVAEFDDVREKRDRLLRKLGPRADGGEGEELSLSDEGEVTSFDEPAAGEPTLEPPPASEVESFDEPAGAETIFDAPPDESLDAPPDALPVEPPVKSGAGEEGDFTIQESATRGVYVYHVDDDGERRDAVRALAESRGARYSGGGEIEIPAGSSVLAALDLLAEGIDPLAAVGRLARDARVIRALVYAVLKERGTVFGAVDLFPPPFDPEVCATHVLSLRPRVRRILTVGEAVEPMSKLRETLGQSRCSTAVAFDARQAAELIPLVRPELVLVDLALAKASGLSLLLDLSERSDPPLRLAATWSKPVSVDVVRAAARTARVMTAFTAEELVAALAELFRPTATAQD